jgi:hypothetical protein
VFTDSFVPLSRHCTALAMAMCAAGACAPHSSPGQDAPEGSVSSPARAAAPPNSPLNVAEPAKCVPVAKLPAAPRKLRDRKPPSWEMSGIRTYAGGLTYDITVGTSGRVVDVRLVTRKRTREPSARLAELWRSAIHDWQFEPAFVGKEPVAVCMTVHVIIDVM